MHKAFGWIAGVVLVLVVAWWWFPWEPAADPGHGGPERIAASGGRTSSDAAAARREQRAGGSPAREARAGDAVAADLAARLVQAGSPLADTAVELWSGWHLAGPKLVHQTRTDGAGRLAVRGVARGRYALVPRGDTVPRRWARRHVHVRPGKPVDLGDVVVPRGGVLLGRIVDETGRPVLGMAVFHGFHAGYSSPRFRRDLTDLHDANADPHVRTGADGSFRFDRVAPGHNFILGESLAYADVAGKVELGEGVTHDFGDLVARRGRPIVGRVIAKSGKEVAGAHVYPESKPRKGCRTDKTGAFRLTGVAPGLDELEVRADGFLPLSADVDLDTQPLLLTLEPAIPVTGRVHGTEGEPTTIYLDSEGHSPPTHVFRVLMSHLEIAADGTFRVVGLTPGAYSIVATTKGVGMTPKTKFTVGPALQPLELHIRPYSTVVVHVRDDTGAPVARARVVRDPGIAEYPTLYRDGDPELPHRVVTAWRSKRLAKIETDATGRAELMFPENQALALGADHGAHLPAARCFQRGRVPQRVELTLRRAAKLVGRISDPRGTARYSMTVSRKRVDGIEMVTRGAGGSIDAKGRFEIARLAPGEYEIGLHYYNMTWEKESGLRLSEVTPLVGDGVDRRTVQRVTLGPGETKSIVLEVPPLGSISGRVLSRGAPVPGVTVYAAKAGTKGPGGFGEQTFDAPDAHDFLPHTATDDRGRFRFAYASAGAWDLRARHPKSAVTEPPVRVAVTRQAQDVEQDLAIGGASVRGRVDLRPFEPKVRKGLEAYLFRTAEAHTEAFGIRQHGLPKSARMLSVPLGPRGEFEFSFLPAGDWVLRIAFLGPVLQRRLQTTANATVDLGVLRRRKRLQVALRCVLPEVPKPAKTPDFFEDFRSHGAYVRERLPDRSPGMFVTEPSFTKGVAAMELWAGEFEIELYGLWRAPAGKGDRWNLRTFTVRPDGTVAPRVLDFTR